MAHVTRDDKVNFSFIYIWILLDNNVLINMKIFHPRHLHFFCYRLQNCNISLHEFLTFCFFKPQNSPFKFHSSNDSNGTTHQHWIQFHHETWKPFTKKQFPLSVYKHNSLIQTETSVPKTTGLKKNPHVSTNRNQEAITAGCTFGHNGYIADIRAVA
jgi:hypothetical protein